MPLSFAFAMMIGWFNGTIVDKTGCPSFIVTLGTFFVLIGAKLGFAKLFAGQVVVEGLNEADGYDFWRKIFAASWIRNDHIWEDRDVVWTILLIAGVALVVVGVLELSYRRAGQRNAKGLIAVGGRRAWSPVAGFYGLLNSDGVQKNVVNGVLARRRRHRRRARLGAWRFRADRRRGAVELERVGGGSLVLGVVFVAVVVRLAAPVRTRTRANAVGVLVSDGFARRRCSPIGLGVAGVLAVLVAAGKVPVWSPLAGIDHLGDPGRRLPDDRPGRTRRACSSGWRSPGSCCCSSPAMAGRRRRRRRPASASSCSPRVVVVGLAFFVRSESTLAEVPHRAVHGAAADRARTGLLGAARVPLRGAHRPPTPPPTRWASGGDRRHRAARRRRRDQMLYTTAAENAVASGGHPVPHLDPLVHALRRVRHVAADAHPLRQLDLRRRRQQGGRPGEGVPAVAHQDDAVHDRRPAPAWLVGMLIAFRLNSVQAQRR